MGGGFASIAGVPVVPEPRNFNPDLPVSNSSDEWKDKGAAVSVRREVDASGKTVMKSVKKGVRDFSFGRILGEGSYSTVYLATDRQTLKEYAIKVLEKRHIIKERKIKYVNIEKDTLNRLTEHPGIVRLYYTFQDENSLYYVLDLCSGGELLGILKKTGTFDEECTRFFGAQILDAIEYMHSRGVIHRDLKPENCLLDSQGHLLLTDFGLSKVAVDEESGCKSILGTIEYMAPEIVLGQKYGKAVDWWSLGALAYDLMTGNPPFRGGNHAKIQQNIVKQKLILPYFFGPDAKDLLTRLLNKNPAKRLGANMPKDLHTIKCHRFFKKIDWKKLAARELEPPIKPLITDPELAENFAPEFTDLSLDSMMAVGNEPFSPASPKEDDPFTGFSFVAPSSLLEKSFMFKDA